MFINIWGSKVVVTLIYFPSICVSFDPVGKVCASRIFRLASCGPLLSLCRTSTVCKQTQWSSAKGTEKHQLSVLSCGVMLIIKAPVPTWNLFPYFSTLQTLIRGSSRNFPVSVFCGFYNLLEKIGLLTPAMNKNKTKRKTKHDGFLSMTQKPGSLAMLLLKFKSFWDCKIEGCGIDLKFVIGLPRRVGKSVPILFDLYLVLKEHTHTGICRHWGNLQIATKPDSECASLWAICLECADRFLEGWAKPQNMFSTSLNTFKFGALLYQSSA